MKKYTCENSPQVPHINFRVIEVGKKYMVDYLVVRSKKQEV